MSLTPRRGRQSSRHGLIGVHGDDDGNVQVHGHVDDHEDGYGYGYGYGSPVEAPVCALCVKPQIFF